MLKALASITARLAVAFGLLVVFHDSCMCSIQEVAASPVQSLGGALASGDPQLEQLALEANLASDQPLDQGTAPAEFEQAQLGGGGTSPPQPTGAAVAREYVWGPGDRGLDELLAQFDAAREPLVVLQDAGLDALAACDLNGTGPGGEPGAARVAAQYAYDPYGRVISNENLLGHAWLRAGHKGLFADRLDGGMFTSTGVERPRLKAGARVQYHVRNRVLDPELGRWLQRDPNATGLVVLASQSHGAMGLTAAVNGFSLDSHYGDGPNVYEYVRGNPWTHGDPLGLFYALSYGSHIGELAADLVSQYSLNLWFDSEWASDWSQHDDAHSRLDNGWIAETYADAFNRASRDILMGPIDDILDLIELGDEALRQLFEEGSDGPTMAGIPKRLPFRRAIKHDSQLHRVLMVFGAKRLKGLGVRRANMRLNQALVDPVKNVKLSNMRPDVQGFIAPRTIYIQEVAVSQSTTNAAAKWTMEANRLRGLGYNVRILQPLAPDDLPW